MIFAIDQINKDPNILNGITLGYNIQGTCDDSIENMFYALDAYTNLQFHEAYPLEATQVEVCENGPAIAGVVGPSTSGGAASISSLFRLLEIPVISYEATDPELGNHKRYPTFFRTIYADDKQAQALVDLIANYDWNYISVVGSDDNLGRTGM